MDHDPGTEILIDRENLGAVDGSARLSDMPDPRTPDTVRAFAEAPTSLSVTDVHGRIILANDAFWELFGWEPGSPVDVGMLSLDRDEEWTSSYVTRLVTGDDDEFRSFKRFVRRDGSEFDGRLTVRPIRDGDRCVALIGHVEPVEVRPMIDDERLRKILRHDASTMTLIDEHGHVIETAGRYRATLGYPPEFWEDRTILDIVVPDDVEHVAALRDDLLSEPGKIVRADIRVIGGDRRVHVLEATAVNLLADPDVHGILISTRNVTEERANAATLERLRDDAVAEAERRSHLLALVSHELRNPLHAMSGLTELLASDTSLDARHQELAASIHRQLIRLATVTDDLLETSQFETGQFQLRSGSVLVRDLIDDLVSVGRAAADGRIAVDAAVDAGVPATIVTDPARIQQILGNLLHNAIKFTATGRVDVAVGWSPPDKLVVEVSDTGVGIPAAELDRVFNAFTTATTSGDRRGAGLGLAIVTRLVDALGGTIEVSSAVGEGTTFTVTIPDGDLTARINSTDERDPDRFAVGARRVLVVEDTPVNQELARHQLDRLGIEAVIAGSAEEALELLARDDFDAVLMDHQLPGMNGREATRAIRATGSTVPIVGVTASSTAADERACLDAGMNAFVPKPAGLDQIRSALNAVIDDRRATSRSRVGDGDGHSDDGEDDVEDDRETDRVDTVVDHHTLDQLADELGDRSVVGSLIETFLAELAGRRADITDGSPDTAARQAHTLKSSARLLGADALADACEKAELDPTVRRGIGAICDDAERGLRSWLAETRATEIDD